MGFTCSGAKDGRSFAGASNLLDVTAVDNVFDSTREREPSPGIRPVVVAHLLKLSERDVVMTHGFADRVFESLNAILNVGRPIILPAIDLSLGPSLSELSLLRGH